MYLSVYVSVVLCWIYNYNGVSLSSFYGEGNLCVKLVLYYAHVYIVYVHVYNKCFHISTDLLCVVFIRIHK